MAKKKSFMSLTPGANVIRDFTAVSYIFSFVLGKSFQPSLIFEDIPGPYPRLEHLKGASLE